MGVRYGYMKKVQVIDNSNSEQSELTLPSSLWIATSSGNISGELVRAHKEIVHYEPYDGPNSAIANTSAILTVEAKMEIEHATYSKSAAFSTLKGDRKRKEVIDKFETRLCYERDRDRIIHSDEFRRLADKTQVFLNAGDHQRTRATHSFEVAQIASAIATSLRLNVNLVSAIALGHDCGHGPGGHAAEEAFSKYLPGGFNHAKFGAELMGSKHNLCELTLDGIRNHSWSLDTPMSCEGEIVAWADRIAYVCHDYEDALRKGILKPSLQPDHKELAQFLRLSRTQQISLFINDLVKSTIENEAISMSLEIGEILCEFRKFNHEKIYNTDESKDQNQFIINMLDSLVDYYSNHFELIENKYIDQKSDTEQDRLKIIITYLAGMTDTYAIDQWKNVN